MLSRVFHKVSISINFSSYFRGVVTTQDFSLSKHCLQSLFLTYFINNFVQGEFSVSGEKKSTKSTKTCHLQITSCT